MQPGIDLRLRTMMKAMTDVVLPAIDPGNRMAVEQAQLVLGSMNLLREQIDYAHWYEVADLRSLAALAERLEKVEGFSSAPADLAACRARGAALADRADVTLSQLREASADLRDAVCLAVESAFAVQDPSVRKAVQRLVLDQSEAQLGRERAYIAAAKWDGFPETLQTIEASLRGAA